jgi:hypothetical protein
MPLLGVALRLISSVMPEAGIVTPEIEAQVRNSEPMRLEREWRHSLIYALSNSSTLAELEKISRRFLHT